MWATVVRFLWNIILSLVSEAVLNKFLSGRGGSPSVSATVGLGTGFNLMDEEKQKRSRLEEICRGVVNDPLFLKRDITGDGVPETFCNLAVNRIAIAHAGYYGFCNPKKEAISANEICKKVRTSQEWRRDSADRAQEWANKGSLAIAAWNNPDRHGHVAVVFPGELVMAGGWRMKAPMVANVGKTNHIAGANYCFTEPPEYYLYMG